jgi:transposase
MGKKGASQFAGGPPRIACRVVPGATDFKRGGGGRPHRTIDRDSSRADANAVVLEEARFALAADGCHSCPPQKSVEEHVAEQQRFLADELRPRLDAAQVGQGHVFFVDAAHFVFGTFLCCLWSFGRLFVRAASGRQRFNVLGAWNAVTRELIAVTNTTVVNTETMCELLREVALRGLAGPITLVLDNARYQRNAVVQALATELEITLLYLPSYSPNLNLIERLWKFIKRKELYGKYHARFDDFRTAIQTCLSQVSTAHRSPLKSLMTLNFQTFENVSLLSA